jgi:hypothetical protein
VKRAILVGGLLLLALLGAAGGYLAGDRLEAPVPTASGDAKPLGDVTTAQPPLPRHTPEPNNVPGLDPDELDFRRQTFTVHQDSLPPVRLSVRVPAGWQKTVDKKAPGEVKFLDSLRERGVRVEAGFAPGETTTQKRDALILGLKSSQPYENDLRIVAQSDDTITGIDGRERIISTIAYTYVPGKTLRYVIVRWVATAGDSQATVEMSITGLPQDADALNLIADQAARSATPDD